MVEKMVEEIPTNVEPLLKAIVNPGSRQFFAYIIKKDSCHISIMLKYGKR
jgi:hypothetical protein